MRRELEAARRGIRIFMAASALGLGTLPAQEQPAGPEDYANRLAALRRDIQAALPEIPAAARSAYVAALAKERAAQVRLEAARKQLAKLDEARALVRHARDQWIPKAEKEITRAEAAGTTATTPAERDAAKDRLARWQNDRANGLRALEERTAHAARLAAEETAMQRDVEAAREEGDQAARETRAALSALGLDAVLTSDRLDAQLAELVILVESGPDRLAAFAAQNGDNRRLVESLLRDPDLMVQMVTADGAREGRYGEALQIYRAIQQASAHASRGALQRLALAVALEYAVPVKQWGPGPAAFIDPVRRYLHYEQAFRHGELQAHFGDLQVWDYRFVVGSEFGESDDLLAWGREMLRSYRPDHIANPDDRWRYVAVVPSEIRYGSEAVGRDREDRHLFQNILANGGVCGRRAFFGRFILRAFGVPTTARPQPGHAALVRWTPDGWVPVLGGDWGSGWTRTRYGPDRDFLANTQARSAGARFLEVKRAQWIALAVGERPVFGAAEPDPGFWNAIALQHQRALGAERSAGHLQAVGGEAAEADVGPGTVPASSPVPAGVPPDGNLAGRAVAASGTLTIPATDCVPAPTRDGRRMVLASPGGGWQLHYSRRGRPEDLEYHFEASAGTYALSALVATPAENQYLEISVNGGPALRLALPGTIGRWQKTAPVAITARAGANVLRIAPKSEGYDKGLSLKEFTLEPVR